MKSKYAPFMRVHGERIKVGQKYYAVNTGSPDKVYERIAHTENPIISECYFSSQAEAELFSSLVAARSHAQIAIYKILERQPHQKNYSMTWFYNPRIDVVR